MLIPNHVTGHFWCYYFFIHNCQRRQGLATIKSFSIPNCIAKPAMWYMGAKTKKNKVWQRHVILHYDVWLKAKFQAISLNFMKVRWNCGLNCTFFSNFSLSKKFNLRKIEICIPFAICLNFILDFLWYDFNLDLMVD